MSTTLDTSAAGLFDELSDEGFIRGWTAVVGEPPSVMLDDHHTMISVLVDTVPPDPLDDDDQEPDIPAWAP